MNRRQRPQQHALQTGLATELALTKEKGDEERTGKGGEEFLKLNLVKQYPNFKHKASRTLPSAKTHR